jgi:hypothetical protein
MNESDTPRTDAVVGKHNEIDQCLPTVSLLTRQLKRELAAARAELKAVTEQRDRLADALRQIWPFIEKDDYPIWNTPAFNAAILKYKQALQSLTKNEQ